MLLVDHSEDVEERLELLLADAVVALLEVPGQLALDEVSERSDFAAGFEVVVPGEAVLHMQPLQQSEVLPHLVGLAELGLHCHFSQELDRAALIWLRVS